MEGVFLLGLGVQKAGTTWLHDYLSSAPTCDFGFRKEYHVWDLRSTIGRDARRSLMTRLSSRLASGNIQSNNAHMAMRVAFMSDPNFYFDYFVSLLQRPGVSLTGDITPSYSLLTASELASIRGGFMMRGAFVKAVLLLRDPVKRFRSMVRMQNRMNGVVLSPEEEFQALLHLQARGADKSRSDYTAIIQRARTVFGVDLFVTLYEDLFLPEMLHAICDFCGIDFHPPDFDKKINFSTLPEHFEEYQYRALAEAYRRHMPFLVEIFGQDRMSRLWPLLA